MDVVVHVHMGAQVVVLGPVPVVVKEVASNHAVDRVQGVVVVTAIK